MWSHLAVRAAVKLNKCLGMQWGQQKVEDTILSVDNVSASFYFFEQVAFAYLQKEEVMPNLFWAYIPKHPPSYTPQEARIYSSVDSHSAFYGAMDLPPKSGGLSLTTTLNLPRWCQMFTIHPFHGDIGQIASSFKSYLMEKFK